ncbi:probable inactive histone-lysine N-methyltransferase SUVR2 [Daucus carota subsp. sativus]|uniref:probable inactive histone-lysine N-methyltransferase SUVR2 n=1 Tax=Daucus carota subsp. sativus TaxID=79200 RepID=UPI0007F00ED3|nr:PREDICTED: probable inactive histone-lysine N-methyltransferase SUVR2 [Daucus carota subsp. sativus]XP_017215214.1 PREDICTED: probable inactive histone-lysine N-methyltransferase SUVR2 [Daucus carota subsp. sativus]XP_017215215.1 PREDICTED: probable inactive histone-lysine N-methyltransferase SUVR2 [Daucus carota subsp. sativus]XP_017215216.1 PREDICTED: probable inactive histone-lysine N-methyltransferase SUVR2 [Daucus carota subsp. sativus]
MAPNPKVAKACKAMKTYGIAERTVLPVLKNLLDLYDNNWVYIEDENYRVLADAFFDGQNDKCEKSTKAQPSLGNPEECKPQYRKYGLRSQKDQPSVPVNDFRDRPELARVIPPVGFSDKKVSETSSCLMEILPNYDDETPVSCRRKRKLVYQEEEDHSVELKSGDTTSNQIGGHYNGESVADEMPLYDAPLAIIRPGIEDPSHSNYSGMDVRYIEESNAKRETNTPSSIELASSSGGEVKISLICNSPDVRVRSLDAVLKAMEEKCLKSYNITDPAFSLKVMKDVCECFLSLGMVSTSSDPVNPEKGPPSVDGLETSKQLVVANSRLHKAAKFHCTLNLSNGSAKFQNLFRAQPCIPRSVVSKSLVGLNKIINASFFLDDITKGEESRKISMVNEINSERQPAFNYIPKNVTYRGAYVKFLLSRISDDNCCSSCVGDCLSQEIPCACTGETGGLFAYRPGGLLKEDFLEKCILMNQNLSPNLFYCEDCPLLRSEDSRVSGTCNGHVVRNFIKECWYKCGCSKGCGNRVVQRGITANLQVFMTPGEKGWGLRTLENLPKGAFVCEYVGEIVTNSELYDRNKQSAGEKHTYPVLLDSDWGSEGVLKDEEALCLDATYYGNIARFINHRCGDANMVEVPVEIETPDHHYYHVAFFTSREVTADEELTWDYGIDFGDTNHPIKAFKCCCGSKLCRQYKKRKRTRSSS